MKIVKPNGSKSITVECDKDYESTYVNPKNRDEEFIIDSITYKKLVDKINLNLKEKAKSDAQRIIEKRSNNEEEGII